MSNAWWKFSRLARKLPMPDFSDRSTHLELPFIQPSQAQKHVTHNEGVRRLDALVQLSVLSMSEPNPPGAPDPGARYILPAGALGAWAGQPETTLAIYESGTWSFTLPRPGWTAWVEDESLHRVFDGSGWTETGNDYQNLPYFGVQTTADATNRLAVSSEATLFNHAGAGHQLKLNKAAQDETASLLFQTGWSGRAEMGTAGSDDFEIKVSADGQSFHSALMAEATTGRVHFPQGATGVSPAEFGAGPVTTTDYAAARGLDLVANGTGLLGNGYNFPAGFAYDPQIAPNLPASFSHAGRYPGVMQMEEQLPIDPNRVYRLSSYIRQESIPGDWSDFTNGERHRHYMGLICFDRDGESIQARHHMRYYHGGIDSLTTLAAPLAPGDTVVHLTDASGWNESATATYHRGLILFGYRNTQGFAYDRYSRLFEFDLFDAGQVDKAAGTVTLNKPFPAALANPDDAVGIWPAGAEIANTSNGSSFKYAFYSALVTAETDRWYRTTGYIGGIDRSGQNVGLNFPPGTAFAKVFWLPNHSNIAGGQAGWPDTGAGHRVWFAGVSVTIESLAATQSESNGSQSIKVPQADFASGSVSLVPAQLGVTAL